MPEFDFSDIDETVEQMGKLLTTFEQKGADSTVSDFKSVVAPTNSDEKAAKYLKVEYPNGPAKPLAMAPDAPAKIVNSPKTDEQLGAVGLSGQQMTFQQPIRGSWQNLGPYTAQLFKRPVDGPDAKPRNHLGLDLGAPGGTPIYPIAPGVVGAITYESDPDNVNKLGGTSVWIKHYNGKIASYYAHMDNVMVRTGQEVGMDTQIGTVGKTGNARQTTTHLHLGVMISGQWVDPGSFLGNAPTSQKIVRAATLSRLISLAEKYAKRF